MSDQILLTESEFCHIINNNDGKIRLVEGPFRGALESHEELRGSILNKVRLKENDYVFIDNPFVNGKINYGDRTLIKGPKHFSLYPGEDVVNGEIHSAKILTENQALYIAAGRDFKDGDIERKAGDIWMINGPAYYIPHKYAIIQKTIQAIALGNYDGLYIQNIKTGGIRLEKGPQHILLTPDERLFRQTHPKYSPNSSKTDLDDLDQSERAPVLWIYENQASLLINNDKQRVVFGPNHVVLEPFEKPYVMSLSGGTPKRSSVHHIWKLKLGPDFMTDVLKVRTKDNAELQITIRCKWRFVKDPEDLERLFTIKDFIGYSSETVSGIIRNEAAKHNFEEFHSDGAEIIRKALFINDQPFRIKDNGFEIFHIDIKNMVPVNPEIAKQLNSAIKSNMDVYVKKIKQEAEIEAKKAEVEGSIIIEEERKKLNQLELENERLLTLGKADIQAEATLRKARAEAEARKLKEMAVGEAENEVLQKKLDILKNESSNILVQLEQTKSFNNTLKTIVVPSDSKVVLGPDVITDH